VLKLVAEDAKPHGITSASFAPIRKPTRKNRVKTMM
jgi:hypothetical protein